MIRSWTHTRMQIGGSAAGTALLMPMLDTLVCLTGQEKNYQPKQSDNDRFEQIDL